MLTKALSNQALEKPIESNILVIIMKKYMKQPLDENLSTNNRA